MIYRYSKSGREPHYRNTILSFVKFRGYHTKYEINTIKIQATAVKIKRNLHLIITKRLLKKNVKLLKGLERNLY